MRDLLRYKYNAGLNFFGVLDEKYYLGSDSWRGHTLSDYPEIGDSRQQRCDRVNYQGIFCTE